MGFAAANTEHLADREATTPSFRQRADGRREERTVKGEGVKGEGIRLSSALVI